MFEELEDIVDLDSPILSIVVLEICNFFHMYRMQQTFLTKIRTYSSYIEPSPILKIRSVGATAPRVTRKSK